ncbi:WD40 repeat domain-containing protein [Streptomyces xanthophaeus]|uniref:WD40 repeat domain-containing protein n=1 Tax=Streptomyces xanthophaeus TaxID=67385 RepID=UPI0036AC7D3E
MVDLDSGEVRSFALPNWQIKAMAGLANRRIIAVTLDAILLFELTPKGLVPLESWCIESEGSMLDIAVSDNGSRFAVAAGCRAYIGSTGKRHLEAIELIDCMAATCASRAGTLGVSGSGSVHFYGTEPRNSMQKLQIDGNAPILSAGLSPDGRQIVVGDDYARSILFDVAAGEGIQLDSPSGKPIAIDWNPDSNSFVVLTLTREVAIYSRSGETLTHLFPTETGTYYMVGGGWTADGRSVVSGTEHGRILTWTLS